MIKINFIVLFILLTNALFAQLKVDDNDGNKGDFPLVTVQKATAIYYEKTDAEVVGIASTFLAGDIRRVTGRQPAVVTDEKHLQRNLVLIGTIGHNRLIDQLITDGKLDVGSIRNGWERFMLKTIEDPFPGVARALVIAGSDRRGTAYGVFTVSKAIGVSPWYWWADVPVKKKKELYLAPVAYVSRSPSVKYRGIFINDEDWGILQWASNTYDPALHDIGPKTYRKVFELLLRLKANMLAPAMHPCSGAFNKYPENKVLADSFGIVMSSSHCEPLLFNNASEWNSKTMGPWNYLTNKKGILKALDQRVAENSSFENIYTIALRGIHDAGMIGVPQDRQVSVLEEAVKDQRGLLEKHINKPVEGIPQVFVPYKEVLNIYEQGMKLPGDITIVWPDDNYGYLKRLSNEEEQKRKGRSGVYYHISYLGHPHDYLWINTTSPALMYEELHKAYVTGADRYWLLNVGDLKPGELGIQLFTDMAWNIDQFNSQNIAGYESNFLSGLFGERYKSRLKAIMDDYYRLAFIRKPEYMDGNYKWNSLFSKPRIVDTGFSLSNYNEAEDRLADYNRIATASRKLLEDLPEEDKAAFFELVDYPVEGASLINKEMLTAQQNRRYARQGRSMTNLLAKNVQSFHDSIALITREYNSLQNGKWNHIVTAPGFLPAPYLPPLATINLPNPGELALSVPGEDCTCGVSNIHVLPCFNKYTRKSYSVDVYNKGTQLLTWSAHPSQRWILLSRKSGKTNFQDRVTVSVDWGKVPVGQQVTGVIDFNSGKHNEKVYVSVFNPQLPTVAQLKGLYVEDNGVVAINPGHYSRKEEKQEVKISVLEGLGYEGQCIQLGTVTDKVSAGSKAEYDFYTFNAGSATVYSYALPLFAVDKAHGTSYGVAVDDGAARWVTTASAEDSGPWKANVIRNSTINVVRVTIAKPGKHTLKLVCGDPGMVIQKVVIDLGGMKRSYQGPAPTWVTTLK